MTDYRAVVTLQKNSHLPEDNVQNTFHFRDPSDDVDFSALLAAIQNFYNGNTAGANTAIADLLSTTISRANTESKTEIYELPASAGPIGSPIATSFWTLEAAPTSVTPLPEEVAVVLSFHANLAGLAEVIPGGPPGPEGDAHQKARNRGRIYLGPISSAVSTAAANDTVPPRPGGGARTIICAAASRLITESAAADAEWATFSRVGWLSHTVVGGWVDDAFDTQRRRGVETTTRTLFT